MISLELTIAGIATGCVFALAGMGVVLTYKATGIFNFAHGAIAMVVAYVFWQTRSQWHWPLLVAAVFSIGLVGPAIGVVLERLVFRPLQRRRASTAEKLVATVGVFILMFGLAFKLWTGEVRNPPRLITNRGIHLPDHLILGVDQLVTVVITVAVGLALALMFRRTRIGIDIRAVVDRRELAELSSVNANRVAGLSWAMGCGLAGLTGVLLPELQGGGLDPIHLTLLVIETFSVAVVAGLTSLPIAVGGGILLGVLDTYFVPFEPRHLWLLHSTVPGWVRTDLDLIKPNVSVLLLFAALVILRRLDEPADSQPGASGGLVSRSMGAANGRRRSPVLWAAVVAALAVLLPFTLGTVDLARAQVMLALIVVFTSIVCITGFCGYITLGQAGFAGFGAYMTGRMVLSAHLPVVVAMLVGGLAAMLLGLVAGYPALNRRGLFLGLTTLSVGLLAYRAVFTSDVFKTRGLAVPRPGIFGWSLSGDYAFYFFELVCVVLVLALAHNLRSGRLGRILAAMRDSEVATQSIGIELRTYKLFIFAASAFIAGIGGSLLAQQAQIFSGDSFDPITSFLWFTVVMVAGVASLWGAILAGVVFELLDVVLHANGASQLVIGAAALLIGYIPGHSLVGLFDRIGSGLLRPRRLQARFNQALAENGTGTPGPGGQPVARPSAVSVSNGASPNGPLEPTDFAERVLGEVRV